ncbi:MAG: DUF4013 domain-containing protein [Acidobacteriota bacterium]
MDALPAPRPRIASINVNEAWNGVFQDPAIVGKLLIGSVVALLMIPVFPLAVPVFIGYGVLTARNAAAGETHPMPDWDRLGEMWILGAKYWLAVMVYMSPLILAMGAGVGMTVFGAVAGRGAEVLAALGIMIVYACYFGALFLQIAFQLTLFPVLAAVLAVEDSLGAMLSPRRLWGVLRDNPWNIILAGVLKWASGLVATFACFFFFFPMFPVLFLGEVLSMATLGQAQRLAFEAYGVAPPEGASGSSRVLDSLPSPPL